MLIKSNAPSIGGLNSGLVYPARQVDLTLHLREAGFSFREGWAFLVAENSPEHRQVGALLALIFRNGGHAKAGAVIDGVVSQGWCDQAFGGGVALCKYGFAPRWYDPNADPQHDLAQHLARIGSELGAEDRLMAPGTPISLVDRFRALRDAGFGLESTLQVAVRANNSGTVHALARNEVDVNAALPDGWTPLLIAVENGHTAVVEALLRAGGDVTACQWLLNTPLHRAAFSGCIEIVTALLEAGGMPMHGGWNGVPHCTLPQSSATSKW